MKDKQKSAAETETASQPKQMYQPSTVMSPPRPTSVNKQQITA